MSEALRQRGRAAAQIIALAAAYFITARLGLSLATVHENVTLVWPPAGLALAALLLLGLDAWPGIALGAFLANAVTHVSLPTAAGIAAGNSLEAIAGFYLLKRVWDFKGLDNLRDVLALTVVAAPLSTAVAATIGTACLCLSGAAPVSAYGTIWPVWWAGDLMGVLMVAPVLLAWFSGPLPAVRGAKLGEALILGGALAAIGQVVFGGWLPANVSGFPLAHTVFPFLIWAALRFGQRGATLATLYVAGHALWDTVRHLGPFGSGSLGEDLALLQVFLSVISMTALLLAAAVAERNRAEEQQRQLERQVREAQKLESLGVLAGGVAHDFNNLMMSILGNTGLALADSSLPTTLKDRLVRVEEAAERAAEITGQMLAYAGKGRFMLQVVDLSAVVGELVPALTTMADQQALLTCVLAPGLPLVESDLPQLRQLVLSLAANAFDAVGANGRVSVSTGMMEADLRYLEGCHVDASLPPGHYVYLEIADDGCGMNDDTLARIFEPFFSTKFIGRGLSLAAVLGIVRGHKGGIKVSSAPGQGTTVRVLLPGLPRPTPAPVPVSEREAL